jgi:hypothetical protein
MVRERPTGILVLAILHIVGGAFGLFGSCYAIALMAAATTSPATTPSTFATPQGGAGAPKGPPAPPSASEIMKYYEDHVPGYKAFTFAALAASTVLDVMLITGGIGLLRMQPWARMLSIVYAPLSILFHIVSFVYQLVYVVPATHELFSKHTNLGPMAPIMEASATIGAFLGQVVMIYPIVVLVMMLRRKTVAAFRGEAPPRTEESFEDDPWREPPPGDATMR